MIVHRNKSSFSHALRILKYSEQSGRNMLDQLLANIQKKKTAYTNVSIYLSMQFKITSVKYVVSLEKSHAITVIRR